MVSTQEGRKEVMVRAQEEIYNMIRELQRAKSDVALYDMLEDLRKDQAEVSQNGNKSSADSELIAYDMMLEALFWVLGSNVDLKKWVKNSVW